MNKKLQLIRITIILLVYIELMDAQWIMTDNIASNNGLTKINCFAISKSNILAGGNNGVFISTNDGTSWREINNGLPAFAQVFALAVNGSNYFAGLKPGGVFLSTNNGTNWVAVNNGLSSSARWVNSFIVSNGNLFAGTGNGIFLLSDNGTNWIEVDSGLTVNPYVYCLALSDKSLYAASATYITPPRGPSYPVGTGIFRSINNGNSWSIVSTGLHLDNDYIAAVSVFGKNLFVGTSFNGIILSTNNGISWDTVNFGLTNIGISAFAFNDTSLFVGTQGGVFLYNKNNGTSWNSVNTGMPAYPWIEALAINGTNLFASIDTRVWKRPLSEMITSVEQPTLHIQNVFNLHQNFPNPFNPYTTITYQLQSKYHVTLKVFDVMGREMATLVNDVQQPGNKSVRFDAGTLASGIYFYRLQSGSFTQTKKLLLLK